MPALQPRLPPSPFSKPPQVLKELAGSAPLTVPTLEKLMFLSVMLLASMKLAPRLVMFWIVPPEPRSCRFHSP